VPTKDYLAATLIAGKDNGLEIAFIERLVDALQRISGLSFQYQWVKQSKVGNVLVSGIDISAFYDLLRKAINEEPIDVIVQPADAAPKKFLLADMESTIIEQEMIDELAAMIGIGEKVAEITYCGMNGEIDFKESLKQRTALFAGQPASLLDKAMAKITPVPGAIALIKAMKEKGAPCWLVSGGFDYFAQIVAERYGFDRFFSNKLLIQNEKITGEVAEPILDGEGKKAILNQACSELGLTMHECLVVGDGANDIPMLSACNERGGLGIAYRAKPKVREAITHQVNHADLAALVAIAHPIGTTSGPFQHAFCNHSYAI